MDRIIYVCVPYPTGDKVFSKKGTAESTTAIPRQHIRIGAHWTEARRRAVCRQPGLPKRIRTRMGRIRQPAAVLFRLQQKQYKSLLCCHPYSYGLYLCLQTIILSKCAAKIRQKKEFSKFINKIMICGGKK